MKAYKIYIYPAHMHNI